MRAPAPPAVEALIAECVISAPRESADAPALPVCAVRPNMNDGDADADCNEVD